MKAFDVIGAIRQDQSEDNQSVKEVHYQVDQKQQIRIPITKKIQIDSITHEMRKPKVPLSSIKFHLIKTKQPPIHIINSKNNHVLGLDTSNQTWNTGTPSINGSQGGFFDIFKNADPRALEAHNQHIQNQRGWFNPFDRLRQHISSNQLPNPSLQNNSNLPNLQLKAMQDAANTIPPQPLGYQAKFHEQQIVENNQSLELPNYKQTEPNVLSKRRVQSQVQQGFVQSQVQQVHLNDLPQTFHDGQNSEGGLFLKFTNFFASFNKKMANKKQTPIHNEESMLEKQSDKMGSKQNEIKSIEESLVRQYNPEQKLGETISRKIEIEQSIVISNLQYK